MATVPIASALTREGKYSAGLTLDQRKFLIHHGIPVAQAFNTNGSPVSAYKQRMKDEGYLVAYGVAPCARGGHTLRTRHGHCVQCDSKHIAYILRHSQPGHVYLAHSPSTGLFKVGASVDPDVRKTNLNVNQYGGASDWVIQVSKFTNNYAKYEHLVHEKLDTYRAQGKYYDRGGWIDCAELYRCSLAVAQTAFRSVMGNSSVK
jgi:hypothetical protein